MRSAEFRLELKKRLMSGSPGVSEHFERDLAFTGLGRSGFGKRQGRTWTSLAFEACTHALGDARLTRDEIDGLCVHGGSTGLPGISAGGARRVLQTLDLHPTWHSGSTQSPGQIGSMISAMLAISAGLCRHVLCLDVRTGSAKPKSWLPEASTAAAAYLETWGHHREVLGWVAIAARRYASLNPEATHPRALDMDGYLSADMIFPPFGSLDVATPNECATAVVISSARLVSAPRRAVWIDALGTRPAESEGGARINSGYLASAQTSASHMWARASGTPGDVDVALIDDRCTFDVLRGVEALGLCAPGRAAELLNPAVQVGPGGDLPLNPDGGQLAAGHPGGYSQVYEAILQLRGDAGARQVPNARVGVVLSNDPTGSAMALVVSAERT